jgi:negative regulator of flagellin synthesis FlgM
MKIDNHGQEYVKSAQLSEASRVDRSAARSAYAALEPKASRDEAILSSQAILLAKARAALDAVPEIRSEPVDALKAQVETGTYQVPIERLVARLLGEL